MPCLCWCSSPTTTSRIVLQLNHPHLSKNPNPFCWLYNIRHCYICILLPMHTNLLSQDYYVCNPISQLYCFLFLTRNRMTNKNKKEKIAGEAISSNPNPGLFFPVLGS